MADLTRFRGPAAALGGILAALVAVDLLLTVAVGRTARWLPAGEIPADRWIVSNVGARLAGMVRASAPGGPEAGSRFGLLLGQSTMLVGVDAEALEADDGRGLKWVNLSGLGGSTVKIAELADLVFLSGLRPEAVVLGINPYMLVGLNYANLRDTTRTAASPIKRWVWTWENRSIFSHLVQVTIFRLRVGLLREFGLGLEALFRPDPEFRTLVPAAGVRHSAQELENRLDLDRRLGWLDARHYRPDGPQASALSEMIRGFLERGAEVYVVLMPERSMLRHRIPEVARDAIRAAVRDASPGAPVPLIDLEDRVPDELFFDLDHLLPEGRAICTRMLAQRLRAVPGPGRGTAVDRR